MLSFTMKIFDYFTIMINFEKFSIFIVFHFICETRQHRTIFFEMYFFLKFFNTLWFVNDFSSLNFENIQCFTICRTLKKMNCQISFLINSINSKVQTYANCWWLKLSFRRTIICRLILVQRFFFSFFFQHFCLFL